MFVALKPPLSKLLSHESIYRTELFYTSQISQNIASRNERQALIGCQHYCRALPGFQRAASAPLPNESPWAHIVEIAGQHRRHAGQLPGLASPPGPGPGQREAATASPASQSPSGVCKSPLQSVFNNVVHVISNGKERLMSLCFMFQTFI